MAELATELAEQPPGRVRIEMVPPAGVDALWPLVEPMLAPLFDDYPLEDLEDVRASIESTHRQLWLVLRDGDIAAVAVTQIVTFPRARVLEIMALAGENVLDVMKEFDEWATEVAWLKSCDVIQVIGRPGWTKHFKQIGGERAAVIYRKLMDGRELATGGIDDNYH